MRRIVAVAGLVALGLCGCTETTTSSIFGTKIPERPLTVLSEPSGASVAYVFSMAGGGDPQSGSCETPCHLSVPYLRTVRLEVTKPGFQVVERPALHWAGNGLTPNPALFRLAPKAP